MISQICISEIMLKRWFKGQRKIYKENLSLPTLKLIASNRTIASNATNKAVSSIDFIAESG